MPRQRLFALLLLVLAPSAARAVDPNLRIHVSEFPLAPLQRVVFAYDAGPTAIANLISPTIVTAADLEAQPSWDFSGLTGELAVLQTAPVAAGWSCYVPDPVRNGCGFALANNDLLLVRDNLASGSRGATALDFDGTATLYERAQTISEGTGNEIRLCLNPAYYPNVAFLKFQGTDALGPYLSGGDPSWASPTFSCSGTLNSVVQGSNCNGSAGTGGGFDNDGGTAGQAQARVIRAGTLTLPSGHVVDSILVEALASFSVRIAGCLFDSGQAIRLYQLFWYVPHYGAIAQMVSPQDTASLTAWRQAESTSIGFGLLPPLSITADSTTASSVTVSWDPGRVTSEIDEFVVHWGTQPGAVVAPPDSSELRGDTIPVTQTSYTITGLAPATTYYVSVTTKRAYTDPLAGVTTAYRSIELPLTVGADVDGDGTRETSYPPEVAAVTAAGGGDEMRVNRQVRLTASGASPTVGSQMACGGMCVDQTFPGPLPMSLPGEAPPSGTASLWLYLHSDPTTTMKVAKSGAELDFVP